MKIILVPQSEVHNGRRKREEEKNEKGKSISKMAPGQKWMMTKLLTYEDNEELNVI
jgi:hypothetical protein